MSGLRLVFDNDSQRLAQGLAQMLARNSDRDLAASDDTEHDDTERDDNEHDDPFASDILVVGNYGAGRWLQQRVADQLGVTCLLPLEMPAGFLWRLIAQLLDKVPARSPFDPQSLRWLIFAELSKLTADSSIEPHRLAILHGRLHEARANERMMLARAIAACFNELLAFRRDWLDAWARDQPSSLASQVRRASRAGALGNEAWLSWLWRRVLAQMPTVPSRHPFDRFLLWLRSAAPSELRDAFAQTGVRTITVFGVPELAPEQIELFGLISQHLPVQFLVNDPCREFWQDIVSPKQVAAIRATQPDVAWLYESEPSVLGAWGKAHRDYLTQLRGLEEKLAAAAPVQVEESFRDRDRPPPVGRLQALQQTILLLDPQPWQELEVATDATDYSLQIHSCHGALRQLQVLRDRLLHAFELLPDLQADQVFVLAPEIDSWAPLIDGVFGDGVLPYSIEGQRKSADPLRAALADLLLAAQTQPGYATIASLLANPALALALQLDDDERQRLLAWLDRTGFRGGDGKHSWQAALDRLWYGAAVARAADQAPVFAGDTMAIAGATPATMPSLGKLARLFGSVQRLSIAASRTRALSDWCELLARECDQWFAESSLRESSLRESRLRLHDALAALAETQAQALSLDPAPADPQRLAWLDIDLVTFSNVFAEAVSTQPAQIRPGSGISFAPIESLRGVPARVIALIGMSESQFPAARRMLDFDLLAHAPRFGDQTRGNIDRAAFLDMLVAAGDMLIMTYDGRELRSNELLNPSAVVSECLAYINRQAGHESFAVIEQPLMPFNPTVFLRAQWPSYDSAAFAAADGLAAASSRDCSVSSGRSVGTVGNVGNVGVGVVVTSPFIAPEGFRAPPATATDGSAGPPADSNQPLIRDQAEWVRALARPAQAYLRAGLRLSLPYVSAPVADHEPVDVQDDLSAQRRQLVQQTLDASLFTQQWPQWQAARSSDPTLPQGPGALFAGALLDQQALLMRSKAIKEAGIAAIPESLRIETVSWRGIALHTGWLDTQRVLADDRVLQFVWSAWGEGAHSAINVWLCHAAAQLWAGDTAVQTIWVQDDRSLQLTTTIASPVSPVSPALPLLPQLQLRLQRLLGDTQALCHRPGLLFPKTCYALHKEQRRSRASAVAPLPAYDDGDFDDGVTDPASDSVQKAFALELADPWVATLFRDGAPQLAQVLRDSDAVYGDLFAAFGHAKAAKP